MNNLYNILARSQAGVHLLPLGPLLDFCCKFLDDLEVYIGLQQSQPDFPEGILQILFGYGLLSAQLLDGSRQFIG